MAATPEKQLTPEESALRTLRLRLHRALRVPRRRELPVQGAQGPDARARREDLRVQGRAAVDARLPPEVAGPLPRPPDADLGLADAGRGRLRRHPLLRARLRALRALLGRRARGRQEDLRPPRHPRGRAQVPGRRRRAVRVRVRLPPGQRAARGAGRHVHGHGHRAPGARGPRARVHRRRSSRPTTTSSRAQQRGLVGRLVRLRAAGRPRRDAAAGLLPHQHGEHGPVRADDHHRRRGLLRALRRGLHRADVQQRHRCTRRSSSCSPSPARASATRPCRTGRTTSSTWSPSAPGRRRPTRPSSGSTATSARSSR